MTAASLLRLRAALRRHGVPLRSIDVGERLRQPVSTHVCQCGHDTPKHAVGKRGDRWICAGHRCGRPWPLEIRYLGTPRTGRVGYGGQKQLDRITDLAWALNMLPERVRRVLELWDDTREVPRRSRDRQYDLARRLRRVPAKILADYDVGLEMLDAVLRERGVG